MYLVALVTNKIQNDVKALLSSLGSAPNFKGNYKINVSWCCKISDHTGFQRQGKSKCPGNHCILQTFIFLFGINFILISCTRIRGGIIYNKLSVEKLL